MNKEERRARRLRQAEEIREEYNKSRYASYIAAEVEAALAAVTADAHRVTSLAYRRERRAQRRFEGLGDLRCAACGAQLGSKP